MSSDPQRYDRGHLGPADRASDFTVVICTRNRPAMLGAALQGLAAQDEQCFATIIVDQSDMVESGLRERVESDPSIEFVHDRGRGVSRARNIGWRSSNTEWVVYIDDDVVPEPDWAREMCDAMRRHPGASVVVGDTPAKGVRGDGYLTVSAFRIDREEERSGRWLRPWLIGLGAHQAFRRSTLEDLGGFDERLGAGARHFPSSEDMDFNYRFLRRGGTAALAPDARVHHEQWRSLDQLGPHYEGYTRGWSGFAAKHLRGGDVFGGLWLWSFGFVDFARMAASAARRRSGLRLIVASYKARGLVVGTAKGLLYPWGASRSARAPDRLA